MNLALQIGHISDTKELERLKGLISDRIALLHRRLWLARCAEAWGRVATAPPGTPLFCCADGTFLGGPFQRGDRTVVHCVQPRKRRLWVRDQRGKLWGFPPAEVHRYNLQPQPPANPLGPASRALAESLGKAVEKILP